MAIQCNNGILLKNNCDNAGKLFSLRQSLDRWCINKYLPEALSTTVSTVHETTKSKKTRYSTWLEEVPSQMAVLFTCPVNLYEVTIFKHDYYHMIINSQNDIYEPYLITRDHEFSTNLYYFKNYISSLHRCNRLRCPLAILSVIQ